MEHLLSRLIFHFTHLSIGMRFIYNRSNNQMRKIGFARAQAVINVR